MRGTERLMREILKEYEAPNKLRKAPHSTKRYVRGRKIVLTSK